MEENGSEGAVPNSDGSNTSADVKPRLEVKSSPNERPESPDSNCAICLGKLQNKSFTDSCLHQFCFSCLVEWSKVKPECPLCKQGFKSIIHNVRSIEDYDQYDIFRPVEQPTVSIRNFAQLLVGSNRPAFRFRTTMVPVIGLLQRVDSFIPPVYSSGHSHSHSHHGHSRHSSGHSHRSGSGGGPATIDRRFIYNQGLWVRRLPDITGRYRKCSPRFLAQNPAQVHRLVPWLHRELSALLGSGRSCEAAMTEIMAMVVQHPIRSVEFRNGVETFLGSRTDHFIHEFHSFAISPYDTIGYDRYATYGPGPVSSFHYEQEDDVDSSSSSDSDVQIVDEVIANPVDVSSTSGSRSSASPEAGPSGLVVNIHATTSVSSAPCIDIATETESDMEDCVIIGTVKPRHLRTPEVITISDDDVDVENCNSDDEQNDVNVEDVSSEEDIKPTPEEIANISADSCKPSTSYSRSKPQKMKMSKNSRFRRIYSKFTSSDSDSSSSSSSSSSWTSSSEDNWNESKRKRVKSRSTKKKSKEREKRAVKSSRQVSRASTKRNKRDSSSSDSASSDDEADYKRNRTKRKRVATNSSSISSHSSQRSRSPIKVVVESSPLRLRSVVKVRRNTQDSNYSVGDAASSSSHSHGSDSRLMDGHRPTVAWSRSASSSSSSSITSASSTSSDWSHQRRNSTSSKYKFKRKH